MRSYLTPCCPLPVGAFQVSLNKTSLASTVDEVLNRMKPMVGNRIQVHWTPAAVTVVADDQKLYQVGKGGGGREGTREVLRRGCWGRGYMGPAGR